MKQDFENLLQISFPFPVPVMKKFMEDGFYEFKDEDGDIVRAEFPKLNIEETKILKSMFDIWDKQQAEKNAPLLRGEPDEQMDND